MMYFGELVFFCFFFFLAVLGHFGVWLFSSCWQSTGSRVHRLSSCGLGALAGSMWDFSSLTGIELMSPALECLFLTTGPPGKS